MTEFTICLFSCGCLQLNTLRGSILEDAVPSTSKHGLARGLPLKEVLEYLVPELNVHCLRLALNTPKVTEQLMKLDEQGVKTHYYSDLCDPLNTIDHLWIIDVDYSCAFFNHSASAA